MMIDEQLIQQGEQKGREEALKEMARTLLLSGVDKETIMTATGFTSRELELLSH
nr:transposase [Aliivibrio fischeri]